MKPYLYLLLTLLLLACNEAPQEASVSPTLNPPAKGFDVVGSDVKAIALADSVMQAMGGRQAWDDTRFLKWTFFGRRTLWWDKEQHRVRIEIPEDQTTMVLHMKSMDGRVQVGDQELTKADSLDQYLKQAKEIWINDSYWLVMPFKLKDSGVTLKYLGEVMTQDSTQAEGLALTFKDVGVTSANKYHVAIDPKTHLITEWAFYSKASDEEPRFTMPWLDYKKHGQILLSGNRGKHFLSDIEVKKEMDESLFNEL